MSVTTREATKAGVVGHQLCTPIRRRATRLVRRASARRHAPRERHRADVWSATEKHVRDTRRIPDMAARLR
eukprot:3089113-Amphidinium_carterae.2